MKALPNFGNMKTKKYVDDLAFIIIGAAIEVHKAVGPGLLESVYEKCLVQELKVRGLGFEQQKSVQLSYKGMLLESEMRCDFLVEQTIVVELKAVLEFAPVHQAQLLTYMRLLNVPKGVLLNFNCSNIFREGQRAMVNEYYRNLPT